MSVPQCICRDQDNPRKLVLFFHHVSSRDRTQAVRLDGKHFYPWSHLDGLERDPEKTLNLLPFCGVWILGPHFWISPQDATCLTSTLGLFPFKAKVLLTPRVFAIRTQCRETPAKLMPRWERKRLTDITIGRADLGSAIWLTNVVGSTKELLKIKGLPSRSVGKGIRCQVQRSEFDS